VHVFFPLNFSKKGTVSFNYSNRFVVSMFDLFCIQWFGWEVVCCLFCWCWCNCWSLLFSGKTTLTETLEKKLKATRFYTPPPEVCHLRKFFDALPEIIRRAYYCIGNCIVAIQIAKECQHKAVIMDRYSIAFYDRKPPQW
jgi:hypothetical protein